MKESLLNCENYHRFGFKTLIEKKSVWGLTLSDYTLVAAVFLLQRTKGRFILALRYIFFILSHIIIWYFT